MQVIDELGTVVYFTMPKDAVVVIADNSLIIRVGKQPFLQFARSKRWVAGRTSHIRLQDDQWYALIRNINAFFAIGEHSGAGK